VHKWSSNQILHKSEFIYSLQFNMLQIVVVVVVIVSTDSVYNKFVRNNFKVQHCHPHDCLLTYKQYSHRICMLTVYFHMKFHLPSSSGSVVIAITSELTCRFHAATMLFYMHAHKTLNQSSTFSKDLLSHPISELCGARVAPTS
jgi:hypothetical protein